MIHESTVRIGQQIPLQGIVSLPETRQPKLGVILLNSGVMHRVGACRMTVRIARRIAEDLGIFCLRFDFSGVGDSEPRRAGDVDFESVPVKEVQEAMDYCQQQYGIDRFILYGLCSGAHTSCKVAEIDNRVAGIIQVDGYCYPTLKSYLLYYLNRAKSAKAWLNRFKKLVGIKQDPLPNKRVLTLENDDENFDIPLFPETPEKSILVKRLSTIIGKNIQLHCIFTGTEPHYFYKDQYLDAFSDVDFGDLLSLEYYPEASHIFTEPDCQQQLIESIVDFLKIQSTRQAK